MNRSWPARLILAFGLCLAISLMGGTKAFASPVTWDLTATMSNSYDPFSNYDGPPILVSLNGTITYNGDTLEGCSINGFGTVFTCQSGTSNYSNPGDYTTGSLSGFSTFQGYEVSNPFEDPFGTYHYGDNFTLLLYFSPLAWIAPGGSEYIVPIVEGAGLATSSTWSDAVNANPPFPYPDDSYAVDSGSLTTPIAGSAPGSVAPFTLASASPIPEPPTWLLLGTGALFLLGVGWKRKGRAAELLRGV